MLGRMETLGFVYRAVEGFETAKKDPTKLRTWSIANPAMATMIDTLDRMSRYNGDQ